MKNVLNIFAASLLSTATLVGCASVNSVSITPIPKERDSKVSAVASKTIILGFNFDNDFIDTLVADLQKQCPNGKVTGILTKDENINYFLYFVWKKQVSATGYCVKSQLSSLNSSNSNVVALNEVRR